jgi:glutamate synthase (NADPH/NADH) small chain
MGLATGFLEIERKDRSYEPVEQRLKNYKEFVLPMAPAEVSRQGARCMDCGIPYCHNGCPVNNIIPQFNELVRRDRWKDALEVLQSTNNFPEFTGRICPAPCEASCTLNIDDNPVTIKSIECAIVDRGWQEGWIQPLVPVQKTGKRVAVVGSGPAGLSCAQQLARAGHSVTLFEKADRVGGLLRYGIPDFKMEKHHIDRRMRQMEAEGVEFRTGVEVGATLSIKSLLEGYDAVALTGGAELPRDLEVPGRELSGIHFAMDFLTQQNKRNAGDDEAQLEVMPQPPVRENKALTWPDWPLKMRTSSSHEEGAARDFAVLTKRAVGSNGKIEALECVRVEWVKGADGRMAMQEVAGSTFELRADLVLLAMGFLGPRRPGLVEQAGVALDPRGNVAANVKDYQTSVPRLFSAGDMRRGQSLVVWAIREGRQCARSIDESLMGASTLPR